MKAESRELYVYIKDRFVTELNRIKPTCISPIIAVRQVVKKAIYKYVADYCSKDTKPEDIFSEDDFQTVSNKICDEIMED